MQRSPFVCPIPHRFSLLFLHQPIFEDMNKFSQYRQRAIDWLNGKRDFDKGVRLLQDSGFKPGVVAKLRKHGENGPDAKARLLHLVRMLVQAWAMPGEQVDDLDPDTGLDASVDAPTETIDKGLQLIDVIQKDDAGEIELPQNVATVVRKYAAAYRQRDMLHKQLAELPEDNSEDTIKKREPILEEIDKCSALMERLYPLYERFQAGTIHDLSDEDLASLEDKESATPVEEKDVDLSAMTKDELMKIQKSIKTKIHRANCQLLYQQDSVADKENPLPPSPAREKYEAKIRNLSAELEKVQYAIAQFG